MCGICGIINFNGAPVAEADLRAMMGAMKYRGPDDEGLYISGPVGLGHVRLSIIDLSEAGRQPMFSNDGRYAIVFNGEIYNYIELRQELASRCTFRTKTDTEVILNAYREWGQSCLDRFNGMFALAIYDSVEKKLFMARDRFGVKPFYYYRDGERFVFASDIPPILNVCNGQNLPNMQIIYDYLVFNRTNHTEQTFFKNIKKLQHAHCIEADAGGVNIRRWYDLRARIGRPFASPEELRQSLKESISFRLRSDVQVGTCLSGGLDSSSIVSLLLRDFDGAGMPTFSAVYEKGSRGDESDFIDLFGSQVRNMHFVRPSAESLYADLDRFVQSQVEPLPGTSEYAEYKVMELARKHCTVLLVGQGADEEMAGYLYFPGFYYKELLRGLRLIRLVREMAWDLKNHRVLTGPASFIYFMLPDLIKEWVSARRTRSLAGDFVRQYRGSDEIVRNLYGSETLNRALVNHFEYKFEHHLIWADRSSMWFSLESRFPFLDHRFVERVLALPPEKVLFKGQTKYILRQAMQGILPEVIRTRHDKVGYETPEAGWFRSSLFAPFLQELISSQRFRERGIIDPRKASDFFRVHLDGNRDMSADIWKWAHLELWFRKFIDG